MAAVDARRLTVRIKYDQDATIRPGVKTGGPHGSLSHVAKPREHVSLGANGLVTVNVQPDRLSNPSNQNRDSVMLALAFSLDDRDDSRHSDQACAATGLAFSRPSEDSSGARWCILRSSPAE